MIFRICLLLVVMVCLVRMGQAILFIRTSMFGGGSVAKRIASNTRERAQADLDKLNPGSVVLDRFGHAWQLDRVYWYRPFGGGPASSWDLSFAGPFKVLWSGNGDS